MGTLLKTAWSLLYPRTTYADRGYWYEDGKIVDRTTFFKNIRGLKMVEDRRDAHPGEAVMVFERTDEPLEVPKLDFKAGPPDKWFIRSDVKPIQLKGYIPPDNDEFYREP